MKRTKEVLVMFLLLLVLFLVSCQPDGGALFGKALEVGERIELKVDNCVSGSCDLSLVNVPADGITGVSFTIDSTYSSIDFLVDEAGSGLIDISASPNLGFFTLNAIASDLVIAHIATDDFDVVLSPIKAVLADSEATVIDASDNPELFFFDGFVLGGEVDSGPLSAESSVCGDGVISGLEVCDDGSANTDVACNPEYGGSCNYCDTVCQEHVVVGSFCGDGVKDAGFESCDKNDPRFSGSGSVEFCSSNCGCWDTMDSDKVGEPLYEKGKVILLEEGVYSTRSNFCQPVESHPDRSNFIDYSCNYAGVVSQKNTPSGGYSGIPGPYCECNLDAGKGIHQCLRAAEGDADGDGIKNKDEDLNRNGEVDPGETDETNPDTDGDGISDSDEVSSGTDPLVPGVCGDGVIDYGMGEVCDTGAYVGGTDPAGFFCSSVCKCSDTNRFTGDPTDADFYEKGILIGYSSIESSSSSIKENACKSDGFSLIDYRCASAPGLGFGIIYSQYNYDTDIPDGGCEFGCLDGACLMGSTLDSDGDTVLDSEDLCPDFDDLLDVDFDGVPDGCDVEACDSIDNDGDSEIDEGFDLNLNGVADCLEDDDGDGVLNDGDASGVVGDSLCGDGVIINCDDNCATVSNPDQADTNNDGVGDACGAEVVSTVDVNLDTDGDGIVDFLDCNPSDASVGMCHNPSDAHFDGASYDPLYTCQENICVECGFEGTQFRTDAATIPEGFGGVIVNGCPQLTNTDFEIPFLFNLGDTNVYRVRVSYDTGFDNLFPGYCNEITVSNDGVELTSGTIVPSDYCGGEDIGDKKGISFEYIPDEPLTGEIVFTVPARSEDTGAHFSIDDGWFDELIAWTDTSPVALSDGSLVDIGHNAADVLIGKGDASNNLVVKADLELLYDGATSIIIADLDVDGDGISTLDEIGLGTVEFNPDTDGDEYCDGPIQTPQCELGANDNCPLVKNGKIADGNPAGSTKWCNDADGSGSLDEVEIALCRQADSDGDGRGDACSLVLGETCSTGAECLSGSCVDNSCVLVCPDDVTCSVLGEECLDSEGDGSYVCVVPDGFDPCFGVVCGLGNVCESGMCIDLIEFIGEECESSSACTIDESLPIECVGGICGGLGASCTDDLHCDGEICVSGECGDPLAVFEFDIADLLLQLESGELNIHEKVSVISKIKVALDNFFIKGR